MTYCYTNKNHVVMRKRFHQRVCSCSPEKGVGYLETRMLNSFVNHGVHSIRCAASCGHKFHRGMLLGDLCAETHHLFWAAKVWKMTMREIKNKDWDDYVCQTFDTRYVRFDDVISEGNCEVLGRRIDEAERKLGLANPRYGTWESRASYDDLRLWKYDYTLWDLEEEEREVMGEYRSKRETERIFSEGLCESAPQPLDAFDYWRGEEE